MIAFRIAWRSFLRHRRRSIITSVAVSLGLAMMLIFVGMAKDGHDRMAEMGIRLGSGHVVVQGRGFQEEQTLDYLVADPARVMAAAAAIPGVERTARRVRTTGLVSTGAASKAVIVAGVDPDVEPLVSSIASKKLVAGEYLRKREELAFANAPADIYVGRKLMETLNLELEDRVVLTVSPLGAARPAAAAFTVRGVFHSGMGELDGFYVEIPIREAQKLLKLGDKVTQVAVMVDELEVTLDVSSALGAALADDAELEVLPWQEALAELYEAIVLDDIGMYMMMAIIFIIVAIGIFNTVLMSVVERTREFGVMLAVGTSHRLLFKIVMAEALVLAVVASIIGLAVGLALHAWMASSGLDMAALYGEDFEFAGIVLEGRIYSSLSASVVSMWTLVVMGIVILSALYPALRATRLKPVEAMRHA